MSNKIFFLLVVILFPIYGQQIDIHSPKNIKKFADFLFCDKDYLRAIDEYKKYLEVVNNDTS